MKKIVSLFVFALMLIFSGYYNVSAYENPYFFTKTGITMNSWTNILGNNEWVTKTTWSNQTITITAASTKQTSDCTECTYAARVFDPNNNQGVLGSTIKKGQTRTFLGSNASSPGQFNVMIQRVGFSLWNNTVSGYWTYD